MPPSPSVATSCPLSLPDVPNCRIHSIGGALSAATAERTNCSIKMKKAIAEYLRISGLQADVSCCNALSHTGFLKTSASPMVLDHEKICQQYPRQNIAARGPRGCTVPATLISVVAGFLIRGRIGACSPTTLRNCRRCCDSLSSGCLRVSRLLLLA